MCECLISACFCSVTYTPLCRSSTFTTLLIHFISLIFHIPNAFPLMQSSGLNANLVRPLELTYTYIFTELLYANKMQCNEMKRMENKNAKAYLPLFIFTLNLLVAWKGACIQWLMWRLSYIIHI